LDIEKKKEKRRFEITFFSELIPAKPKSQITAFNSFFSFLIKIFDLDFDDGIYHFLKKVKKKKGSRFKISMNNST